jgi:hypothetical protein
LSWKYYGNTKELLLICIFIITFVQVDIWICVQKRHVIQKVLILNSFRFYYRAYLLEIHWCECLLECVSYLFIFIKDCMTVAMHFGSSAWDILWNCCRTRTFGVIFLNIWDRFAKYKCFSDPFTLLCLYSGTPLLGGFGYEVRHGFVIFKKYNFKCKFALLFRIYGLVFETLIMWQLIEVFGIVINFLLQLMYTDIKYDCDQSVYSSCTACRPNIISMVEPHCLDPKFSSYIC